MRGEKTYSAVTVMVMARSQLVLPLKPLAKCANKYDEIVR